MKISQMKNIIVLKDLPSNLVDEAIVILKNGSKVKNKEIADKSHKNGFEENQDENFDIAIKEAEYIVGDYMKKLEKPVESPPNLRKMRLQYKKMQICSALLGAIALIRDNHRNSKIEANASIFLLFFRTKTLPLDIYMIYNILGGNNGKSFKSGRENKKSRRNICKKTKCKRKNKKSNSKCIS